MSDPRGEKTWRDGSKYKGSFKNNKRHGKGILTSADGSTYKGYFKNNQKDGNAE